MLNGSKPYKILFDINNNEKWLGGVNYYKNLFQAISMQKITKVNLYIPSNNSKCLFEYAQLYDYNLKTVDYKIKKILYGIFHLKFSKKDYFSHLFDSFLFVSHTNNPQNFQTAITWIPDFQHIHLPEYFSENELDMRTRTYKNWAANSSIVILSSKDAQNDFVKMFPEYADKVRVLHFVSYINPDVYNITENIADTVKSKFALPEKYFYLPNQFWQHKNHITVFKAVNELKKSGININLVCSGHTEDYRNNKHFADLQKYINDNSLQDSIKILGVIEQEEVYYLMRNCIAIINPSLFEGWSSTVEEAKSLGKDIILSDLDVHKEQNPKGARFFQRENYRELAEILKEYNECKNSAPNYELEAFARSSMESRMIAFGEQYLKIAEEIINSK